MTAVTLRSVPDLQAVIRAAFPSYRKLKAFVSVFNGGVNVNSYWDGGSRDEYAIVELASLRRHPLPTSSHPYFDIAARGLANRDESAISTDRVGNVTLNILPEGFVLVSAGTFCGKPATAHVYVHPANMPKFITDGGSK